MSSSDSQSDYSSDSDFNDDEDEVQNQSSRHPSISSQKRNIQIGGRNYVQIQELLQLCSDHHHPYNSSKKDENSIPHNYQLGEKNWKDLWIPSMVALGMSYYNYKDNSKKSASDVLKNSDKLVKKSHLLSTSSSSSTTIPSSNNVDSNTPSILTQQKQKYILSMLNKMESQLEDHDPLLAHNFTENTSNIIPTPQSTTSESSSCHNTSTPVASTNIKVSSNIQYAFENKIKYGHVRAVLEQATAVIRKISKEIKKFKEKDRKLFIESQIQVHDILDII